MKKCTKCNQDKPKCLFRKEKGKDGLSTRCKPCETEYYKMWVQTEKGRKSNREKCRRYRTSEHGKIQTRKYIRSDKRKQTVNRLVKAWGETEKGQKYLKKYRESEKYKEASVRYFKSAKGRECLIRAASKRRANMKMILCDLTVAQWEIIQKEQNWKCAICGEKEKLTRDHIIPITKGGQHIVENIQALCLSCNARKGNRAESDKAIKGNGNQEIDRCVVSVYP